MTEKYQSFTARNRTVEYRIVFEPLPPVSAVHKWVGAQSVSGCLYGIPNDMDAVLKYRREKCRYLKCAGSGLFQWTGGCVWNGTLYGFPRASGRLLKMPLDTEAVEYLSLQEEYSGEHHYGGVCTKEGMVYQPPRNSDHILVWDLKKEKTGKIALAPETEGRTFRYCGSILHPGGFVYFLPELGERAIKLDSRTGEWAFIGERIDAMVFDAKAAGDGCIYGYSAYCPGILKLNTETDCVEMIHKEICPGAYGTKLGVNGHLYSIPGDGEYVWDYDPLTDSLKSIYRFSHKAQAKYAGGATMENGSIYGVPARENQMIRLEPDAEGLEIPRDIYSAYFADCY